MKEHYLEKILKIRIACYKKHSDTPTAKARWVLMYADF